MVILVVALVCPRALLFFIWLLTNWDDLAFSGWIWPFAGFVFLPWTTLAYMGAMIHNDHKLIGFWFGLTLLAFLADCLAWKETLAAD
jgi:hypothetical protein